MTQADFVHLHLHSAYSLAEGAIKIDELIGLCKAADMPAVAVTDTNNMFGALEFAMAAARAGIQPIIGCQVAAGAEGYQLVLLAQNEQGYRNLCKLVSDAYLQGDGQHEVSAAWEDVLAHAEGLICLTGGPPGPLNQNILYNKKEKGEAFLLSLKDAFGDRLYIELQRHRSAPGGSGAASGSREEETVESSLLDLAYKHDIPLVATNDCYFTDKKAHEAHDALLCIAGGRYITEDDRRKVTPNHYFKNALQMSELFKDIPEAIANTNIIAQRCSFLLKPIDPILPPFKTEGDRSEVEEIKAQSEEGLKWRLKNFVQDSDKKEISEPYWERLEYELDVINQMGFPGYFLIVSDFIKWAKEHDIPVGPGRGSGGGSVVAWALKITDLDPLALNLLFERFLNPERVSMPDFDIDFCQDRRDEVIRYVQERYGYDHVAQIITFGKLQARAVVRDVGRVLQMPYGQVDRIAKMIPNNPANPTTLQEALDADPEFRLEIKKDENAEKLIEIALQLEGLYRHASTHAAGVVIGDRPLHELIPMYRDPRSDMPVTQFNMKYVEQAGLVKFDFLGLKTMTVIHKAVGLVKQHKNVDIDVLELPFDDEKTFEMLKKGDNIGVFQVESAGMRDLGRQIGISNLEELLAVIALFRPGPMENIPVYLENVKRPQQVDYMHEKLKPITEDTHGVMIYQEQVMQAAQVLAGYTLGGADLLRRAMGKKIQAEMDSQREMFVKGAKEKNDVPEKQANLIFDQIAAFAGYGFNKAHTAGYGLVSYWTGWLKANYPVEFMAASMTLDLGNTDKLSVFKQELDRMGILLLLPDVNHSYPDFAVEGESIRYALAALKGVGSAAMASLVKEREEHGKFKSVEDFANRIDPKSLNKRQFEQLAAAGAFDSLNPDRAQMHAAAETILRHAGTLAEEKETGQDSLFGGAAEGGGLGLPRLPAIRKWDPLETLAHEFGAVGFYLSAHPLDSREQQFERMKVLNLTQVQEILKDKSVARMQMAGILLKKQEKVSQKGSKYAFLQLSDPTGVFEITLFSEQLNQARAFLEAGNALLLTVDAEQKEDQIRFTANSIAPLDEALEGKIREIQIHLKDTAAPMAKLKEFLDIEGEGRSQIQVFVELEDERVVEMVLPGRWSLSPQARNILRGVEGVSAISEV